MNRLLTIFEQITFICCLCSAAPAFATPPAGGCATLVSISITVPPVSVVEDLLKLDSNLAFYRETNSESDAISMTNGQIPRIFAKVQESQILDEGEIRFLQNMIQLSPLIDRADKPNLLYKVSRHPFPIEDLSLLYRAANHYSGQLRLLDTIIERERTRFSSTDGFGGHQSLFEAMDLEEVEAQIYKKLGYTREGYIPTFLELLHNVKRFYEENGVPDDERLTPVIYHRKKDAQSGFIRNGVNPLEAFPESPGSIAYAGRMDAKIFIGFIAEGKFPIAGSHDVGHLAGLLSDRGYTRALRRAHEKFTKSARPSKRVSRWLQYTFEMLNLTDPLKKEDLKRTLLFPGFADHPTNMSEVRQFFDRVGERVLLQHADLLSQKYETFFRFYGGAISSPSERFYWFKTSNHTSQKLRESLFNQTEELRRFSGDDNHLFLGRELQEILRLNGRENDPLLLVEMLDANASLSHDDLIRVIRDYVSRMEYGLWEGLRFQPESLIDNVTDDDPSLSKPFMNYLRETCSPYSNLYRSLLEVNP